MLKKNEINKTKKKKFINKKNTIILILLIFVINVERGCPIIVNEYKECNIPLLIRRIIEIMVVNPQTTVLQIREGTNKKLTDKSAMWRDQLSVVIS